MIDWRFWNKVDVGQVDECWEWLGARGGKGYGYFHFRGQMVGAHRVSWMLCNQQEIPEGMHVLHRCDNMACVNPHHLWLGTNHDNVQDREAKGRGVPPITDPAQCSRAGKARVKNAKRDCLGRFV